MPSFSSLLALAALSSLAAAITVNKPGKNTVWDSSKSNTIEWTSVSTDPTTVDIYLAHMASQPQLNTLLFANVPTSKGSEVVSGLQLPNGVAYQINLVAHDKPEQIYAQSQQFNITGEAVPATSTLEGYTGPTYSATASKETTASGTKTTLATSTTATGSSSTSTDSSSSAATTGSSSGSSGSSSSSSNSSVTTGATPSASTTPRPNSAVSNGAASGLAALIFGAVALLI